MRVQDLLTEGGTTWTSGFIGWLRLAFQTWRSGLGLTELPSGHGMTATKTKSSSRARSKNRSLFGKGTGKPKAKHETPRSILTETSDLEGVEQARLKGIRTWRDWENDKLQSVIISQLSTNL